MADVFDYEFPTIIVIILLSYVFYHMFWLELAIFRKAQAQRNVYKHKSTSLSNMKRIEIQDLAAVTVI